MIFMWDVLDAFVDMMCLGDVLVFEGGSISLGGRWVQVTCPLLDGECKIKESVRGLNTAIMPYCQAWPQSDLYVVAKSVIQRLKRRRLDPTSISFALDLSPSHPWKRPSRWSLKDFENARLVIKRDIYEVEVVGLNNPIAAFKVLGAVTLQYSLANHWSVKMTDLLNRLLQKHKPSTKNKTSRNPLVIIQRMLQTQHRNPTT